MIPSTNPAIILSRWFGHDKTVRSLSYSNGLPWVVESGEVATAEDLQAWVETVVQDGPGYHDALYLSSAYEARKPQQLMAVNDLYGAYIDAVGRRPEIVEQGKYFHRIIARFNNLKIDHLAYPVAVGHAAARLDIPLEITLRFFLREYTGRLISSAANALATPKEDRDEINESIQKQIDTLTKRAMNLPMISPPAMRTKSAVSEHVAS